MPPAIIGGAIAAAGAVGSAVIGGKAASNAAKATQQAADQSAAVQREIYGQNRQTLSPFVQAGLPATQNINALLGLEGDMGAANQDFRDYIANSNYAFDLGEGLRGIAGNYAGAGTVKSGDAIRKGIQFRDNLQRGYRGEYMNALGNQQAMGLSAGSALAGVGQGYANSLGNIYQANGANQANAALVKGQNTANAINAFANIGGSILGGMK